MGARRSVARRIGVSYRALLAMVRGNCVRGGRTGDRGSPAIVDCVAGLVVVGLSVSACNVACWDFADFILPDAPDVSAVGRRTPPCYLRRPISFGSLLKRNVRPSFDGMKVLRTIRMTVSSRSSAS